MNCFHWLICLSLFVSQSNQSDSTNTLSSLWKDAQAIPQFQEGLVVYNQGFSELCSQAQNQQLNREKCYKKARQKLHAWLDEQVEDCLITPPAEADSIVISNCRSGSDAAFRAIVQRRERNQ